MAPTATTSTASGRCFVALGAFSGMLAVAAGAFGAHGLATRLDADAMAVYRTAASYHLIHSVVLCLVGSLIGMWSDPRPGGAPVLLQVSGWSLLLGVVLFSGSLYGLALGGPRWLGPVTPFGGLAFLAGWLTLGWAAVQRRGDG